MKLDWKRSLDAAQSGVELTSGDFIIASETEQFTLRGFIEQDWIDGVVYSFEGVIDLKPSHWNKFFSEKLQIIGDTFTPAELNILSLNVGVKTRLRGRVERPELTTEQNVVSAEFLLCNCRFHGKLNGETFRTDLQIDDWIVEIESSPSLTVNTFRMPARGYFATHKVHVRKTNSSTFSQTELVNLSDDLCSAIGIMRGGRAGFAQMRTLTESGREEFVLVRKYFNSRNDYKSAFWPHDSSSLPELTELYRRITQDAPWKQHIGKALSWYFDGNDSTQKVETSLMLGQVCLELLGWVELILKRKLMSADGYDKLHASDKIRLMLSLMQVPCEIPVELEALTKLANRKKWLDGPHALTALRNSAVHPNPSKAVEDSEALALYEAKELTLFYVELALLWIIGFHSEIHHRYKLASIEQHGKPPWA